MGKSNLFDAIGFLSALAHMPLMEAAKSVRVGRTADVRSLFHCVGNDHDPIMSFEVEMIVPSNGVDDLGQDVEAAITFLRYNLDLAFREEASRFSSGGLRVLKEEWLKTDSGVMPRVER